MKLTRLYLKDIRCFEELEISFERGRGSALLVIGENGHGKSTVLRSLAMGLCDWSSAAALFRELPGEFVRHRSTNGEATIKIDLSAGAYCYRIETIIKSVRGFERIEQRHYRWRGRARPKRLHQDKFPWHRIFASGYGAGIRVQGTADFDSYRTVDALYPLFVYDAPLQNPELVIRRLVMEAQRGKKKPRVHARRVLEEIRSLLEGFFDLGSNEAIELLPTAIALRRGRDSVPLAALGDGYRSIVTIVLDLMAWWFLKQPRKDRTAEPAGMSGIVLIDEVEQHLHPNWQQTIMDRLTRSFPKLQIVATTHSPLVSSGCEGIPVHRLDQGKHSIESPFGWRAEDVYRMMGVPSSRSDSFRIQILDEFRMLDLKRLRRTAEPSELRRLKALRRQLDLLPGRDPLRLTTEIENIKRSIEAERESHSRGGR